MSVHCPDCGAIAGYGHEMGHKSDCPSLYPRSHRPSPTVSQTVSHATWVIVTDHPGCVPQRKGPIRDGRHLVEFLRELMTARPTSHLIVARIDGDQLHVEDGTQALEIADARSAPTARKHRDRLKQLTAYHLPEGEQ